MVVALKENDIGRMIDVKTKPQRKIERKERKKKNDTRKIRQEKGNKIRTLLIKKSNIV